VNSRTRVRHVAGAVACVFLFFLLLRIIAPPLGYFAGELAVLTLTPLIAALIATVVVIAVFDAGTPADYGICRHPGAARTLLCGLVAAVFGACLTVLPFVWLGLAHFEPAPATDFLIPAALFAPLVFCGAAGEEIVFRGYPLQSLARATGAWPAVLITSTLFALGHMGNPGATPLALINTAGFGLLFGAAVLRSQSLWLPIGLHFGWNATLPFLGVELSGLTIRVVRYQLTWSAQDLWSGGVYGPEAGLPATFVLVLLFALLWLLPPSRLSAR